IALLGLLFSLVRPVTAQDLWDMTTVRDFYFTFTSPTWWQDLQNTQNTGLDIAATLVVDSITYPNVGIRMRTSSSSLPPGNKKPFNVTMDAFVPGQDLYGFDTLNLNNGAVDPTLTRETISYRVMRDFLPAPRTAYFRLHLNGSYWGLYILVEQPDKAFVRSWFTSDEGDRYKGDRPPPQTAAVGTSRLNWLGSSPSLYQNSYEAKTPTHPNVWTDLVTAIDKLNNTPAATYKAVVEQYINVDRALWYFACMNLLINSDDYMGAGHNYYLYFDPTDGRMNMIPWDLNEAFGVHGPSTNPWNYPILQNSSSASYPLVQKLLAVPEWRELYFAHYRTALRRWMDWTNVLGPLNLQWQNLIRADVLADPNLLYPNYFNPSFAGSVFLTFHYVHGLQEVAINRRAFLNTQIDLTKPEPLITQVTPLQAIALPGQPFWVTARVTGTPAIAAVELRASVAGPFAANVMYDDGLHQDGAAGDSVYGGSFVAPGPLQRMRYYVHAKNTANTVQVFPVEAEHQFLSVRTEGGTPFGPLRISEFLADNETVDLDEANEFEDWIEVHNSGAVPYDLTGHFLSDDPAITGKWQFPNGTMVPAGGHVRVWCDEEPLDGPLHANFKLNKLGEWVVLSDTVANNKRYLDGYSFPQQKADRSYGRMPDAGPGQWFFWTPTANARCVQPGTSQRYDARRTGSALDFDLLLLGTPQQGQTITFRLDGGTPNGFAFLAFGFAPLRTDFGPLGIAGIDLNGAITVGVGLDAAGVGNLNLFLPPGSAGATFFCQALNLDISNALALIVSP
ncbi:MAG: CotH kinase family protein, partial [Planctomycetota bacterium]|nr:CotH kinase family protein [Planctomycetota bacterium]